MADPLTAAVRDVVAGPVAAAGVDLEDVEVRSAGRHRIVRVSVDTDGGIDLDLVAEITRAVSQALDDTDVMGDRPYTLEVGSPGVSRPLTLPRHWRRNIGRLVRVVAVDGDTREGRIAAVSADEPVTVTLTDPAGGADWSVTSGEVRRAVVQPELTRSDSDRGGS